MSSKIKVGYARVSSHDQRKDLSTQALNLTKFCDVVLQDLGSGLNCKKPSLHKLISMLLNREVAELHLVHKDRLIRVGHELIVQLCKWSGTKVLTHEESHAVMSSP
ncbi:recombinase family protein [Vibrio maritimus]|uniref:recombinase family protein n=1 Tax=Vibrio maritimus TaxID=990268 RepID=UPI0037359AC7